MKLPVRAMVLLSIAARMAVAQEPSDRPARPGNAALSDSSFWEGVRNRTPLESADRRGFYGLLLAVGRFTPRELLAQAGGPTPLAPLFNEPDRQFGRLVNLEGVVRRVTRIRVDDAELRRAYGFDHYYQVELFPADSQNNPLVCCLRTVPVGSEQPNLHEVWQVPGVFFKVWAYHPQAAETGAPRVRLAPLVIGPGALRVVDARPATNEGVWIAAACVVLGGLALAWAWAWRHGDRAARRRFAELRNAPAGPNETAT